MTNPKPVPLYSTDGRSLGNREHAAALALVGRGLVKPAYGRKGHLRAIYLQQPDGGTPVDDTPPSGPRYSCAATASGTVGSAQPTKSTAPSRSGTIRLDGSIGQICSRSANRVTRHRRRGASSAQRGEGYQESLRPFVQDRAIAVRTSPQVLGGGI